MKKNLSVLLIIMLVLSLAVIGCSKPAEPPKGGPEPVEDVELVLATGPAGGTYEVVAAATLEILKQHAPEFKMSIIPGGSTGNVAVLGEGKAQISQITADSALAGWEGQAPFDKSYKNIRGVFALYPNTIQLWATKKSGITEFADLEGKKFTFGQPGGGPYQVGLNLLEMYGISQDGMIPYSWGEANNNLRDGNIDAVLWTTSFPAPAMIDSNTNKSIDLIQISEERLAEYSKANPAWIKVTIPAGTYQTQDKDVTSLGTPIFFAVDENLSDEIVYKFVKALYENKEDLARTHVLLNYINEDTVAAGFGIPVHPGAEKYYKEVGIM